MHDRIKASISVAMCTYNGSRFLGEQLASITAQTRLPDELVICDDGSTDATSEIVEQFARSVSFPTRFITNPARLGSTKNFEKCIELCTGDFIALCDQDDIWLPEKLARQSKLLESNQELSGVFCDARIIDDQSREIGRRLWAEYSFTPTQRSRFRTGKQSDIMLSGNVVTGATLMISAKSRSFFTPIPGESIHDGWIAWMLILYSKISFIDEPLILYRMHQNQQIGLGNLALSHHLTLIERLQKAKRDAGAEHLAVARDLSMLEARLMQANDSKVRAVIPKLHKRASFFRARGTSYTNAGTRLWFILSNAHSYYLYERAGGWKSFLRDLMLVFV